MALAIVALRGATLAPPPEGLRDTLLLAKRLAPVASPLASPSDAPDDALEDYVRDNARLDDVLRQSAADADSMSAALLV